MKIQPYWIEEEARKIPGTNYINGGLFKSFAVCDLREMLGEKNLPPKLQPADGALY